MVEDLFGVFRHALLITGFVFVMMLAIEYLNVLTQGAWQRKLARHTWGQYVLAWLLGATPGCLGAFAVVAMHTHGVLAVGAIVAAMVATSGDESFVLVAMMPKPALLLFGALFVLGIAAGALTDLVAGRNRGRAEPAAHPLEVHDEAACRCFPRGTIMSQWRECSAPRGILAIVLVLFLLTLASAGPGLPRGIGYGLRRYWFPAWPSSSSVPSPITS